MKFKPDCSERWQPLAQAIQGEDGILGDQMEQDGVVTVSITFPSYGEIPGVPRKSWSKGE